MDMVLARLRSKAAKSSRKGVEGQGIGQDGTMDANRNMDGGGGDRKRITGRNIMKLGRFFHVG